MPESSVLDSPHTEPLKYNLSDPAIKKRAQAAQAKRRALRKPLEPQSIQRLNREESKETISQNILTAALLESDSYVKGLYAGDKKTRDDVIRLGTLYDKVFPPNRPEASRPTNFIVNLFGNSKVGEKIGSALLGQARLENQLAKSVKKEDEIVIDTTASDVLK